MVSIRPGFKADKSKLEQSSGAPSLVLTSDKILDLVRLVLLFTSSCKHRSEAIQRSYLYLDPFSLIT